MSLHLLRIETAIRSDPPAGVLRRVVNGFNKRSRQPGPTECVGGIWTRVERIEKIAKDGKAQAAKFRKSWGMKKAAA